MAAYITKRLLLQIPVLIGVTIIIFVLIRLIPGNAIDLRIQSSTVSKAERQEIARELGLDKPIPAQYVTWIGQLARGDFGTSLRSGRPVLNRLGDAIPVSVEIAILSTFFTVLIALPVGVISAVRQDSAVDYLLRVITIGGLSIPSFWLATLFLLVASRQFGWTPPQSYIHLSSDPGGNLSEFLPAALILGISLAASVARLVRSQMLEVLRQDFVRTAWAKGLGEHTVIYRHSLKNALIPVVTLLGTQFGFLIGSTVIIESIFSLPGIGRLTLDGIVDRDYPILQAAILLIALSLTTINFLIDVIYAWLDPRISYA